MLPLFPLTQPVYPGVNFKLRIFEQRYLRLVRDSMANRAPFGVVPIIHGREVGAAPDIFHTGTLVEINDFEQHDDGLLGISIYGEQRFKVIESWTENDGLMVSNVELLPQEPHQSPGTGNADLLQLLDDLVEGLQMDFLFPDDPPSLASLGWRLATLLPLSADIKMLLLRDDDPANRLKMIRKELEAMVE